MRFFLFFSQLLNHAYIRESRSQRDTIETSHKWHRYANNNQLLNDFGQNIVCFFFLLPDLRKLLDL